MNDTSDVGHVSNVPAVGTLETCPTAAGPDDPRVVEAVEEYLTELEAGNRPDRHRFLAQHAAIAPALAECLDGLQLVHALTPHLHGGDGAALSLRPEPLGDFQLLHEVGRGGMGVVYEAVQLSLGRRVALKVLSLAAALDPKQLQRFQNEARAAASLHHTNIVPVHAVGCERGVHYYAMQFIDGRSLASLIAELRDPAPRIAKQPCFSLQGESAAENVATVVAAAGDTAPPEPCSSLPAPRSRAFFRTAALLAKKAAEALEHAHQLAVVHRDVKPANLLLDGRGTLWVTDFGLALFQSDGALTMTGEVLGTLRYMSPEQALGRRGVVDHRTDIYSLGVTLYELLTLRPAFDGQDRQELLHQITAEDPRPPRRLDPSIPVELETIVLKATAKAPADRYATARDLADDLQRFLDDRPILARRPTLAERAAKWARRHRSVVVSGVLLLLTALAALVTTTLLIAHEHAETRAAYDRERAKVREAREQRARAEESFRQAREAVDFFTQLGEEEAADAAASQALRRRMLVAALRYYQDFLDQRHDDPLIQAELEASRARVTRLLGELSALEGAGQLRTLKERPVQDDLKLSAAQREQVGRADARLAEEWRKALRAFQELDVEGQRVKSAELGRATEKAVAEILKPDQAARCKQIVVQLQQRGAHGFSTPDVVCALKLTLKQRGQIRWVQQNAYQEGAAALAQPPRGGPPDFGPRKGPRKKPGGSVWKAVQDKVMAVLTPEQRAKWRELTGAPFLAEIRFTSPGGPGARPGPSGYFGGAPGPAGGFDPRRPRRRAALAATIGRRRRKRLDDGS